MNKDELFRYAQKKANTDTFEMFLILGVCAVLIAIFYYFS